VTPQQATKLTRQPGPPPGAGAELTPSVALPPPVPLRPGAPAANFPVAPARTTRTTRLFSDRSFVCKRLIACADALAVAAAVAGSLILLHGNDILLLTLVSVPLVTLLFTLGGLHRHDLRLVPSTLDETPSILQLTGLLTLGIICLQREILAHGINGGQVAALWFCTCTFLVLGRFTARAMINRFLRVERCLVIGDVDQARRMSSKLAASKAPALIVGCIPLEEHVEETWSPATIRHVVEEIEADRIIIAATTAKDQGLAEFIRIARTAGVNVTVLPRMLEVVGPGAAFDDVEGMTMLGLPRFGLTRSAHWLKRTFDLVASAIVLVVVGPIIAAIAVAIKLDSPGPVFFRQVRVGRENNHFRIFKFRTMVVDAEARKGELRVLNEAGHGLFKIAKDPRVTRVGSFLRRSSLDELPQIFNVLCGDMSLVGPRPLVTDEDSQIVGLDRSRLHLTPGMTGPWQVLSARVPLQEMVVIDYVYVANWSLWLDSKILLRTVGHVARRRNL
jgi:exopolysaccharide biosynthesis polyprenyl glycosylphosphotransferase